MRDLRFAWRSLAIVYIALVIHMGIYIGVDRQCGSASCLALAGGQVVLAVGVIVIALTFDRPWVRRIVAGLSRVPPLAAWIVSAVVLFAFGFGLRPEWVYAHMALALGGLVVLTLLTLYEGQAFAPRLSRRTLILGLTLLFVVVLLIRARALSVSPAIHVLDEPWTMGWALSYLRTGQPSDVIMGGVSGTPYYSLPRYYALVAAWFGVVGVGLWEGRLFSLLVMAASIVLTTLAARRLFDRSTAILTLVVLLGSSLGVVGLRLRHDVGVTFTIALALWVYSFARERKTLWLHVLAGLCAGLGVAAHYHAVGLTAALAGGLYLPEVVVHLRQRRGLPRQAIAFVAGAAGMGALILAWQLLPDFDQFLNFGRVRSARDFDDIAQSFFYHIAQVPLHSRLEFLFLAAAAVTAVLRPSALGVALTLTILLSYLALGLMASWSYGPFDYYSVPLLPVFALLVAHGLNDWVKRRGAFALVAASLLLVPQLGYSLNAPLTALRANVPLRPPPPPAAQWVLDNAPPHDTIIAEHLYFLWLFEYDFRSPLTPIYADRQIVSDEARQAAWLALDPDILVFDANLATSRLLAPLEDPAALGRFGFIKTFDQGDDDGLSVRIYEQRR